MKNRATFAGSTDRGIKKMNEWKWVRTSGDGSFDGQPDGAVVFGVVTEDLGVGFRLPVEGDVVGQAEAMLGAGPARKSPVVEHIDGIACGDDHEVAQQAVGIAGDLVAVGLDDAVALISLGEFALPLFGRRVERFCAQLAEHGFGAVELGAGGGTDNLLANLAADIDSFSL